MNEKPKDLERMRWADELLEVSRKFEALIPELVMSARSRSIIKLRDMCNRIKGITTHIDKILEELTK